MAHGLYLPDGTFQPFDAAELSTEMATRENAGVMWAELEGWLAVLPDPDPVLRKRGDDAAVLADLAADDQVTTAMLSRKNRVLNCPHFALRAGAPDGQQPTPEAENLYQRFARDLERANLRAVISAMLDAPFYGFTPLELVWKQAGDWWHLVDIVPKPYRWFCFDQHNQPVFVGTAATLETRPLPPGKFVFVTHHATYDNPYGLRLLSRCLWPVAFKRGGLTFYAKFVERHGLPWTVGEAPAKATATEKQDMARALARMVQDAVSVIPQGAKVQIVAPGQGQGAIHEDFLSRQDRAISKVLMGQTLTIETDGQNSLAATEAHRGVADDLADADKAMVVDAWNEIAWLYAQVNAGPGVLAPVAAYEEPEDLDAQADLDKKLTEIGVSFTAEHIRDVYGLKETEFTMAAAPGSEVEGASFAAPANKPMLAELAQKRLDKAIADLLPKALKASRAFVAELEQGIRNARSFDELEGTLVELLAPSMQPDALENLLAVALTAAAGHGAASIQSEAEEG